MGKKDNNKKNMKTQKDEKQTLEEKLDDLRTKSDSEKDSDHPKSGKGV